MATDSVPTRPLSLWRAAESLSHRLGSLASKPAAGPPHSQRKHSHLHVWHAQFFVMGQPPLWPVSHHCASATAKFLFLPRLARNRLGMPRGSPEKENQ